MGDSLSSTVFGVAGADPNTDYNPWRSGPPVGGYAPSTAGAVPVPNGLNPNTGRTDPHAVFQFNSFQDNPLASGTAAYLLSQWTPLINLDARATNGLPGGINVTPNLTINGQIVSFANTNQLHAFLQRSAAPLSPTTTNISQVQAVALSTLGAYVDDNTATAEATRVTNGTTLLQVQQDFATSQQSQNNITQLFQQIVFRDPTGYELSQYQTYLRTQSLFAARSLLAHGSEVATFINGQFENVLGRPATASEIAAGENSLTAGFSELDVRSVLAHSAEEWNDLNNTFSSATGAPGPALEIQNFENSIAFNASSSQQTVKSWITYSPTTVQQITWIYWDEFQTVPTQAQIGQEEYYLLRGATLTNLTQSLAQFAGPNIDQYCANIANRAPVSSELSGAMTGLGNGQSLSQQEGWLAASNEVQNDVNNISVRILNHSFDWATLTTYQNSLGGGNNSLANEQSWVAYGSDAQTEIVGNFQNEVGTSPTSSQIGQYQYYFNTGGTLPGLWGLLSQQSGPLITTIFGNELGRAPTAADLSVNEGYFAGGATQSNLMSGIAATPEVTNDITTVYASTAGGTIDPGLQSYERNLLASGGDLKAVAVNVENSAATYNACLAELGQVEGSTAALVDAPREQSFVDNALQGAASTWISAVSTVRSAAITFLNGINPIGSADAAPLSPQQLYAQDLRTSQLPNVKAMLTTIQHFEGGGDVSYGGVPITDLSRFPETGQ